MKKTRVPKGERYYLIVQERSEFTIRVYFDEYDDWNDADYENGNYFYTKEEAEAIANKFRAVLNGADVIEKPSTWEIDDMANNLDSEPCCLHEIKEECITKNHAYMAGFLYGVKWIISKIVK